MTDLELKHWVRGCLSKRRYVGQRDADKAGAKRGRRIKLKLSSYYCQHCGGYHLTSQRITGVPA